MMKKAQEEIVGFVAIVVIISVIGLILLSLIIKPGPNVQDSNEVRKFISSSLEYTSDCEMTPNDFKTLRDLLRECYSNSGKKCLNGNEVCLELNRTFSEVLDGGYRKVGEEFLIKGYQLNANFVSNSNQTEETKILVMHKGNCSTNVMIGGDDFFSTYPGKIIVKLKLCYS